MVTMKELEELTQEIREKLPRLKELEAGIFIIWKDPMLNDVLEWLTILELDQITVEFSNQEFMIVKDLGPVQHWDDHDYEGYIWDLSKPYLKDQSPELITFLHSLIKTN